VHGVLDVTVRSGESELQLVAAQDEIAHPTRTFEAVRLR
jgi:pyridoxine kinase